jgi:hypothetical protein
MTSIFEVHGKATVGSVLGDGLGIGIASGLVVGLTFGFYHAASPEFRIITWWLAIQRKAPWRFKRFLDRAYSLTVLRQSGAAYQFRHLELQLRLDARFRAEQDRDHHHVRPAQSPEGVGRDAEATGSSPTAGAPAAAGVHDPDAS